MKRHHQGHRNETKHYPGPLGRQSHAFKGIEQLHRHRIRDEEQRENDQAQHYDYFETEADELITQGHIGIAAVQHLETAGTVAALEFLQYRHRCIEGPLQRKTAPQKLRQHIEQQQAPRATNDLGIGGFILKQAPAGHVQRHSFPEGFQPPDDEAGPERIVEKINQQRDKANQRRNRTGKIQRTPPGIRHQKSEVKRLHTRTQAGVDLNLIEIHAADRKNSKAKPAPRAARRHHT